MPAKRRPGESAPDRLTTLNHLAGTDGLGPNAAICHILN